MPFYRPLCPQCRVRIGPSLPAPQRLRLGPASESAGPPAGALLASPPRPSAYPSGHDECQRLLVTLQLEKERVLR